MPNRMLRDWTDSEKVNSLSSNEERFFIRLIMKVDDFGCYVADAPLLKAYLFPRLLNTVREADITRWTAACRKAGLIVLYEVSGKRYLQIVDFKQRLDKARPKYPLPNESQQTNEFPELVNEFPAELELELELEKRKQKPPKPAALVFLKEEIEYPFTSEAFLNQWHRWKKYKKDQFRFNYKSLDSERTALADLCKLASKNEQNAIAIIQQSIAKTWAGLFELKNGFKLQENPLERKESPREKKDRELQEQIYGPAKP